MKMSFGKRLLLFVYWLVSVLFVALIACGRGEWALDLLRGLLGASLMFPVLVGALAVYGLLSIAVLCLVFKRESKKRTARGFITVDSAETGGVRIAVSAIEQMVKQAVRAVDGIAEMKISIVNEDDAIAIDVNVSIQSGSHVPTVTMNMQRAIRQYVEMNCGVAVRSVSINVQAVVVPSENGRKGKRVEIKSAPAAQEPVVPAYEAQPTETPVEPTPVVEPVQEWTPEPVQEPEVQYAAGEQFEEFFTESAQPDANAGTQYYTEEPAEEPVEAPEDSEGEGNGIG